MPPDEDDAKDRVEGTVLSPEELDITDDQHVVELDEGRYLISPSDRATDRARNLEDVTPDREPVERDPEGREAEVVHRWMAARLEAADSRYGFDITAVFEGDVVQQELFSNDVITTFENLLVWYAQHVGGDTPVEDVLGILLAESTTPVRLPLNAARAVVEGHGVGEDDTVGDLLEAVRRDGGLRFPAADDDRRTGPGRG